MKYLWKRATGLLLTSALVLGLAACGGTPTGNTNPPEDPGTQQTTQPVAPDSGAAGEKLVYSNGGPEEFFETPWLNPGTYVYNKAVYGHLIVADENLNPIPNHPDALATYEYSADGKTLTFTLRDDAYWHNGEKVTPEDIKWSIEFVAKTPVANAVFISTFSAIAGSKTGDTFNDTFSGIAIDGQKIIITFDKIAPDALLTFTQFAPVPKSEFEGIDPLQVQQAPFFQHPIGCGPFMVEEVNMKNYTILAPFDKYYNGVADFKIQLLPSADLAAEVGVARGGHPRQVRQSGLRLHQDGCRRAGPGGYPRHHRYAYRRALYPPVLPQQVRQEGRLPRPLG